MKCGYCGCDLLPDSAFCPQCGAKLALQAESAGFSYDSVQNPAQNMQTTGKKRKKGPVFFIFGICVLALIAAGGFFVVKLMGGRAGTDNQVVYYKEGALYYTPNVKKESEPLVISDVKFESDEYESPNYVITEDGKYLYFYNRIKEDYVGSLCRVKLSKLKKDARKNEGYIEEIDSNVSGYMVLEDSEKLVYKKASGRLIYLDKSREKEIDSSVRGYVVNQEKQEIVYTTESGEELLDLCVYDMEKDKITKLAKDISEYLIDWDGRLNTEFFVYTRTDGEKQFLYEGSIQGEEKEISDQAGAALSYDSESKSVYYTVKRTETKSLYDYVDDTEAESDAGVSEPDRRDFLTETTEQAAVSSDDYQYYFVEYPEDASYFYGYLDFDSDMNMYSYYNDDDYENNQNYIYYYDDLRRKWYSYDMKGYEAAAEQYENRKERLELREELKEETFEREVLDLYYYAQGEKPVLIAENVAADCVCSAKNRMAFYKKSDEISVRIPISEIYSTGDVLSELAEVEETRGDVFCFAGGEEQSLKEDMVLENVSFSEDGSSFALFSSDSKAVLCDAEKGKIEKKKVLDHVNGGSWMENTFYYMEGAEEDRDLCKYENGETARIVRNIRDASMSRDRNWMVMKDYRDGEGTLELCTEEGEGIRISSAAESGSYAYLDKDCILYKKDEDLYVYTGSGEDRRIDRNVLTYRSMAGYAEVYLY